MAERPTLDGGAASLAIAKHLKHGGKHPAEAMRPDDRKEDLRSRLGAPNWPKADLRSRITGVPGPSPTIAKPQGGRGRAGRGGYAAPTSVTAQLMETLSPPAARGRGRGGAPGRGRGRGPPPGRGRGRGRGPPPGRGRGRGGRGAAMDAALPGVGKNLTWSSGPSAEVLAARQSKEAERAKSMDDDLDAFMKRVLDRMYSLRRTIDSS